MNSTTIKMFFQDFLEACHRLNIDAAATRCLFATPPHQLPFIFQDLKLLLPQPNLFSGAWKIRFFSGA